MTTRVDASPFASRAAAAASGDDGRVTAAGAFRGEGVVARSADSLVLDAAEELSFAMADRRDAKSLAERKLSFGERRAARPGLPPERLEELVDTMTREVGETGLKALTDAAKGDKPATPGALMGLVRKAYDDVSHQYLALEVLKSEVEPGDAAAADVIEQALVDHLSNHGPEIRAGLNIGDAVAAFASPETLGEARALRDFYRTTVLGHDHPAKTYESILERYGTAGFSDALRFLIKALGDELNADGPSMPVARLKPILDDLYQLGVLNAVHDECAEMLGRLERRFGPGHGGDATDLMRTLLPLSTQSWVSASDLDRISERVGVKDSIEAEIYFLREMTAVTRALPPKIFTDDTARTNLIVASQTALDQAIAREEAMDG